MALIFYSSSVIYSRYFTFIFHLIYSWESQPSRLTADNEMLKKTTYFELQRIFQPTISFGCSKRLENWVSGRKENSLEFEDGKKRTFQRESTGGRSNPFFELSESWESNFSFWPAQHLPTFCNQTNNYSQRWETPKGRSEWISNKVIKLQSLLRHGEMEKGRKKCSQSITFKLCFKDFFRVNSSNYARLMCSRAKTDGEESLNTKYGEEEWSSGQL